MHHYTARNFMNRTVKITCTEEYIADGTTGGPGQRSGRVTTATTSHLKITCPKCAELVFPGVDDVHQHLLKVSKGVKVENQQLPMG